MVLNNPPPPFSETIRRTESAPAPADAAVDLLSAEPAARYIDAAVTRLRADGFPATEEMCARLSPLGFDHINFLGAYTFPTDPTVEDLRPLRDPHG